MVVVTKASGEENKRTISLLEVQEVPSVSAVVRKRKHNDRRRRTHYVSLETQWQIATPRGVRGAWVIDKHRLRCLMSTVRTSEMSLRPQGRPMIWLHSHLQGASFGHGLRSRGSHRIALTPVDQWSARRALRVSHSSLRNSPL